MSKETSALQEHRLNALDAVNERQFKILASLGERCSGMEKFRIIVYAYFGALGTIIALAIGFTKLFELL